MVIIAVNCLLAFIEEDTSVKTKKLSIGNSQVNFANLSLESIKNKIKILEQDKFGKICYSSIWQVW
jgi:hypothetical protein